MAETNVLREQEKKVHSWLRAGDVNVQTVQGTRERWKLRRGMQQVRVAIRAGKVR